MKIGRYTLVNAGRVEINAGDTIEDTKGTKWILCGMSHGRLMPKLQVKPITQEGNIPRIREMHFSVFKDIDLREDSVN